MGVFSFKPQTMSDDGIIIKGRNILGKYDVKQDGILVVKLEVGLKLKVREDELNIIKNEPYVQDNFNLNTRRLNRWWYSVYFDKKD